MRILIAFDGSPASRAAVAAAGALFAPAEAVVLDVREPELHDVRGAMARVRLPDDVVRAGLAEIERRAAERAQRIVDDGVALARDAGLEAEGAVAAGPRPWREIEHAATAHRTDLVVCGTHGHPPIGRAFLGSTASSLLHHAPSPVLVVPAGLAPPSGPVIVAYDGSESAAVALRFAARHLRRHRALVTHVWASPVRHSVDVGLLTRLPSDTVHEFITDFDDAYAAHARDIAERGVAEAQELGMDAEARIVESSVTPWRPLLELAGTERSTLIVSGAERTGIVTSALGSVSSGLVHHATTAILVVPRTGAAAPADAGAAPAAVSASRT
jgi:nucleotide-binding universal stress UspA family protein